MLSKTSMTHPVILWLAVVLSVSGTVPNGEKRPLAAIDEAGHDCTNLPNSMNGGKKGCPGAVWSDGSPSYPYCTNTGGSNGRFPWWKHCCKWVGEKCAPKKADCSGGDSYEIENCCTPTSPCDEGHGDCETDADCKGALVCGDHNCDSSKFSYPSNDCCTQPKAGACIDADNGLTDKNGNGCSYYDRNPWNCGWKDILDYFIAADLCCSCGRGGA